MKRIYWVLIGIASAIAIAAFFSKPLIVLLAKQQLKKTFPESKVSIGSCTWQPFNWLEFAGISIVKGSACEIKINKAGVRYNLRLIFKKAFPLIYVHGLNTKINGFRLQGGELSMRDSGNFSVEEITYDKARIARVSGGIRLAGNKLFLSPLSAQSLNGRIEGEAGIGLEKSAVFDVNLQCSSIDISALVRDFRLEEKFEMTGSLGGKVSFGGAGGSMNVLSGNLSASQPGGTLVIKDTGFLENMAAASKQPVEIVVASFKDYHYNNGVIKLSLNKGDLLMNAVLEGETGKRDLEVLIHDIFKRKGNK